MTGGSGGETPHPMGRWPRRRTTVGAVWKLEGDKRSLVCVATPAVADLWFQALSSNGHRIEVTAENLFTASSDVPWPTDDAPARIKFMAEIEAELSRAYAKHGRDPWGRHEFYAVLLEEVDELWDAIKANESDEFVRAELRQVAAMCFRYAETSSPPDSPEGT